MLCIVVGCSGDDADDEAASTAAVSTTTTPAISRSLPTTMESPPDLPGYHVYRPTDLGGTGGALPVVVWANGGCVRFDGVWAPLLDRWASAGFFVVAIAAPPDGATPALADPTTAADQARAIDWAEDQNGMEDGPYADALDLSRVVAAGNSCGGITTIALASADRRVSAAFVLSGSGSLPGTPIEEANAVMSKVSVPVAYVVGGQEDIARTFASQDYDALPEGIPAYIARRAQGDHPTLSTSEQILTEEVSPIAINWSDLTLYGTSSAADALIDDPCPDCADDLWSIQAKDLDDLVNT